MLCIMLFLKHLFPKENDYIDQLFWPTIANQNTHSNKAAMAPTPANTPPATILGAAPIAAVMGAVEDGEPAGPPAEPETAPPPAIAV